MPPPINSSGFRRRRGLAGPAPPRFSTRGVPLALGAAACDREGAVAPDDGRGVTIPDGATAERDESGEGPSRCNASRAR